MNNLIHYILYGILFVSCLNISAQAQEIDFPSFGNYTIELNEISLSDLEFEGPIMSGSGVHEVELIDSKVLTILGVKFLDAGVTITQILGSGELLLDGDTNNSGDPTKSIPFTLKAAYANRGEDNIADAKFFTLTGSNIGSDRFPILARQFQPPGPPPPPPTAAFNQAEVNETAYLYLYGEINVGNVDAGLYSGTIEITVEYQ